MAAQARESQRDPASEALLDIALAGTAWTGSRLAVFTQRLASAARDALVCQCMQVKESSIRAAIAQGADVDELKKRLGCGSVCGSCVPQLVRMCRETGNAVLSTQGGLIQ